MENSSNLPQGDLSQLINSREYQPATSADLGRVNVDDLVNADASPEVSGIDEGGDISGQGLGGSPVGATTDTQNQPSYDALRAAEAQAAQLRAVAVKAAREKIEAEERAFESSIAHLSDYEQQIERDRRELDQTRQLNGWLSTQMSQREQMAEYARQENAKRAVAVTLASRAGVDYTDNGVREYILSAQNPQQMRERINSIKKMQGGANARQLTNSGAFVAGGSSPSAAGSAQPKPRSGDLRGLIQSRSYRVWDNGS